MQLKTHINPLTNCVAPFVPYGRFVQIPPPLPRADWTAEKGSKPWWVDQSNCLGYLSLKTRKILLVNTLTGDEHILEVQDLFNMRFVPKIHYLQFKIDIRL